MVSLPHIPILSLQGPGDAERPLKTVHVLPSLEQEQEDMFGRRKTNDLFHLARTMPLQVPQHTSPPWHIAAYPQWDSHIKMSRLLFQQNICFHHSPFSYAAYTILYTTTAHSLYPL